MPRKPSNRPTDAELAILRILWDAGACTVRDVHDRVHAADGIGYTTVLKTMQIMADKNLVERDESQRAHIYRAAASEKTTQSHLLSDLANRAFKGSAAKLVIQALSSSETSADELDEIKDLLNKMSGD